MWETLPNNADWDCFKIMTLKEILRVQKSLHQVEHCAFSEVIRLFQSVGCVRNKPQFHTAHSSTEAGIISLDAGFRLNDIPALDLWDLIVAVLGNTNQSHKERSDLLMNKREVRSPPHTIHKRKQSQGVINDLDIAWTVFPLSLFGIWLLKCCILLPTNLRNPKRMCRETCCMTHHQENKPRTKLRLQFRTTILNCATSILFPQT